MSLSGPLRFFCPPLSLSFFPVWPLVYLRIVPRCFIVVTHSPYSRFFVPPPPAPDSPPLNWLSLEHSFVFSPSVSSPVRSACFFPPRGAFFPFSSPISFRFVTADFSSLFVFRLCSTGSFLVLLSFYVHVPPPLKTSTPCSWGHQMLRLYCFSYFHQRACDAFLSPKVVLFS